MEDLRHRYESIRVKICKATIELNNLYKNIVVLLSGSIVLLTNHFDKGKIYSYQNNQNLNQ